MQSANLCSLCCSTCSNYKFIQNEKGESTEIYDVTVKYFDPMILSEGTLSSDASPTRVICNECWSHIYDFHEFQQIVLRTRALLLHETKVDQDLVKEIREVSNDCKYTSSDAEDNPGKDTFQSSSDIDDELPLKSLMRRSKVRTRKKSKQSLSKPNSNVSNRGLSPPFTNEQSKETVSLCYPMELNFEDKLQTSRTNETGDAVITAVKIEKESLTDNEQHFPSIKIAEDFPEITQSEEKTLANDKEVEKNCITKRRGRKLKKSSAIPTYVQLNSFGTIRKRKTIKLHNEDKDSARGKLKDKCKENDTFIAKWKPILDCDLCAVNVSNFDEMRDHFRAAHNTRCYIKCCERKFYRRYVLMDHIRLHVNPETHMCDICGKRSTTKYNLKLHKQVVHGEGKQFECEVCHRMFNQKPTLDRHLLTHIKGDKKFFCKECDKGYVVETQLNYHIKTVHDVDRVCDQCGKTIHGVAALKKHLMEHAGIERRKFPCDICGAELVTNNGLRRHKAAYHHDGSTAYVCGICGKVASSENALRAHKKNVHENERRYKCTYCDKAFKRPKVLREHIATHTGVDLYQCPHCPQTFKVSANMHHHRKRAHPVEWEAGRKNRITLPKVNIKQVTNQVVL